MIVRHLAVLVIDLEEIIVRRGRTKTDLRQLKPLVDLRCLPKAIAEFHLLDTASGRVVKIRSDNLVQAIRRFRRDDVQATVLIQIVSNNATARIGLFDQASGEVVSILEIIRLPVKQLLAGLQPAMIIKLGESIL